MVASASVQEAQDMAMIAQMATLRSLVRFMHFFDGFRTSHEVNKIDLLLVEEVRELIDEDVVTAHRARELNPDKPVLHGSAQNPDVFFQAREACNLFYMAVPGIVQQSMDRFATLTNRRYQLFDYQGAPDAERVLVQMGSGVGASGEAVRALAARGEKVGLLTVRLYRPLAQASSRCARSVRPLILTAPKPGRSASRCIRTSSPWSSVAADLRRHVIGGVTVCRP